MHTCTFQDSVITYASPLNASMNRPKLDHYDGWKEIFEKYSFLFNRPGDEILKKQYHDFKNSYAPKIAADCIKSIPILENGEQLIDVKDTDNVRIFMLPDPQKPFQAMEFNSGFPESSKLRKAVFEKLTNMVDVLDNLAPYFGYEDGQISIKVFEGLRSLQTQTAIFNATAKKLRDAYPNKTDEEIEEETSKFVSPVKNNVPVHSTGAAVDIRLWDNNNNCFLDVGAFGVATGSPDEYYTFSENNGVTVEQKANRLLCALASRRAGLTNYPYEHWHYSFGDRYDTYYKDQIVAIYGAVI